DGVWYFQKRVPKAVAHLDGRRFVKESTGVRCADDPKARRAGQVADEISAGLNTHWQALVEGRATEGRRQYEQAKKIASRHGFNYLPAADLASSDLVQQLLKRIAVLEGRVPNPEDDPPVARAVLGAAPQPVMTFKECAEAYIAGKAVEWGNAK